MLTHITIRNFKRFEEVEIELGQAVVLIGPNNSGKTAALQALALWEIGLKQWQAKRKEKVSPKKRSGVTINRRDLVSIPIPNANLLWKDLHVRNVIPIVKPENKKSTRTENVRIDILISGITNGKVWDCGLEFDYANAESFYCRPFRLSNDANPSRMPIPEEADQVHVAFLPPMSGLAEREFLKQPGEINSLLGQGQTAQVLRNLCYNLYQDQGGSKWEQLQKDINHLFGVRLLPPHYTPENSEIIMLYKSANQVRLDLSASGRGMQQTLLLLAHLYANPGTVLLLDEPDAHLEILRQRQIYQMLTKVAESNNSQLIIASHSEVLLNEAVNRDTVIAFVGKPHRIDDRGSQLLKSLREISYDQYFLAEQTGWVLYLEGSTDLAILRSFAELLNHEAKDYLERPFVYYVFNQPTKARDHFSGLREAKPDLVGVAIFDRLEKELSPDPHLLWLMWKKRELENYLCQETVLLNYARQALFKELSPDDLFKQGETNAADNRERIMRDCINELAQAYRVARKPDLWSPEIKASDEFLTPLFENYFEKLKLPNIMGKSNFHRLVSFVPKENIDNEIIEKLEAIVTVAKKAKPRID